MSIYAKLFGVSKPTPEMAAADLILHLFQMAMAVEETLGIRETDPNRSGSAMQEILFAYLNLADRGLFVLFGVSIRNEAMQKIDDILPNLITESLCGKWADDLKKKHVEHFTENMRSAEQEYGHLKITGVPAEDDLFMRCALNVVGHMGPHGNRGMALPLCMVLTQCYADMPMRNAVRGLGAALS